MHVSLLHIRHDRKLRAEYLHGIVSELRWSASQILYLFSIASWIAVIGVIIFSHIGRKTSSRTVALITYIVLGVSLIVFARTTSWVVFSICAIIGVVLAMAVCGVVVPHNLMNKVVPNEERFSVGVGDDGYAALLSHISGFNAVGHCQNQF